MALPNSLALHRALGRLMAEAERDSRLRAEIARARREFFGFEAPDRDPLQQAAADERFAEWYLLERDSEVLGELPVQRLLREIDRPGPEYQMLGSSLAGVFLVEQAGPAVRLRDLQDEQIHEMEQAEMLDLAPGDMVVGRLFVDERGVYVPSAAVAAQGQARGLADAFRSDVAALDLGRRLTQLELEHLLFRRWRAARTESETASVQQLENELGELLQHAGKPRALARELSRALAESPQLGAVMGPAMDELAFDTDADLEALRRLFLALWNAHHGQRERIAPPPPAARAAEDRVEHGLGERLARRIQLGLERKEDLEALFGDVAGMLGEDALDDDDEETEGDTTWEGDLDPLVQEFLWEEQCAGVEPEVLGRLVHQQREAPVQRLDLELVEASDLLRLLLRAYLEAPPAERAARVRRTFDVLARFYAWAERTQEYAIGGVLRESRTLFVDELDRLHRASLELTARADAPSTQRRPSLLRVTHVDRQHLEVAPAEDVSPLQVRNAAAMGELRPGDLILAGLHPEPDGAATLHGMVVVLPAAAETLLG